ncbi:RND transporter [Rhizobacter sp. Root1221]|nr:RND transporter [Rhizobacter sp. Root1221]
MMTLKLSALAAALVLAGCSLAPSVPAPDMGITPAFKENQIPELPGTQGTWKPAVPSEAVARGAWWTSFGDTQLDELEERAAQANPTLASAAARVKAARSTLRSAQADRLPQVTASAGGSRSRQAPAEAGFADGTPMSAGNLARAGLGATYEVDLFRRVGNTVTAARADAGRVEADYRSVLLALQGDVAQTYFAIRTADAELAQIDSTVKLRDENARLIDKRFQAGDVAEIDVARSRTELATVQAEAAALRGDRARLEHALALLLGEAPANFRFEVAPLTDTVQVPVVPPGLPSALLERRPDVAAAQLSMQAATARVGATKAAIFPALALTANAGYASAELENLFKWDARSWLVSAVFSLPIIDGGRNKAAVSRAEAQLEGAVADYRQSVLQAFADVEGSLSGLRSVRERVAYTDTAVGSARRAAALADKRYRAGEDSYFQLMDAQRNLLTIERQAVQLRGLWATNTVGLIRSLGGGWQAP